MSESNAIPGRIAMSRQPRLNHGSSKVIIHSIPTHLPLRSAPIRQIRLLPHPMQRPHPILKRSRVPILRRQPIPHCHHHHIAQLRNPPTENIIRHRIVTPTHKSSSMKLQHHRQPSPTPTSRRRIPAVAVIPIYPNPRFRIGAG